MSMNGVQWHFLLQDEDGHNGHIFIWALRQLQVLWSSHALREGRVQKGTVNRQLVWSHSRGFWTAEIRVTWRRTIITMNTTAATISTAQNTASIAIAAFSSFSSSLKPQVDELWLPDTVPVGSPGLLPLPYPPIYPGNFSRFLPSTSTRTIEAGMLASSASGLHGAARGRRPGRSVPLCAVVVGARTLDGCVSRRGAMRRQKQSDRDD